MNGAVPAASRAAGAAMAAAAIGSLIAMAHHPSGTNAGALAGIVHGAMILLVGLIAWGFFRFALDRGLSRPFILPGLIAYAISLFSHLGAATINGFVVPALAAKGQAAVAHDVLLFAWESNQALAKLGVYAVGLAYIAWSLDLLGSRRDATWVTAGAGIICGALPMLLLATGLIRMDVAGAFIAYALHAAWAVLIGVQLWRGSFDQPSGYSATSR